MAAALLLLAALAAGSGAQGQNPAASVPTDIALTHVAREFGLSESVLEVYAEAPARLILTGASFTDFKVLDTISGTVHLVGVDAAGRVVDRNALFAAEAQAAAARGKVDPALKAAMSGAEAEETFRVIVWLARLPGVASAEDLPRPTTEAELAARDAQLAAEYASRQAPLAAFLAEQGYPITGASRLAPLIFARLSAEVIAMLEAREDVESIYMEKQYEPTLYSAARTQRADGVWARGYTGSGVKVAIVEAGRIQFSNPYLADGTTHDSTFAANAALDKHATQVAGVVASTHSTDKGVAYGAPALMSANSGFNYDQNIINAVEWAYTNGGSVFSNSYGQDYNLAWQPLDRYFDHLVFQHFRTVIVSAGNDGACNTQGTMTSNIGTPGLGFNVITVGSFYDGDTSDWANDGISCFSSYVDPVTAHGDREKPELVAVGESVKTTEGSGMTASGVAGTSISAPMVSGGAALIMARDPTLKLWPEHVRSLLMAGANHNIVGSTYINEQDGAGGVNFQLTDDSLRNGWSSHFSTVSGDYPKTITFSATAGQKVRVVINWLAHTGTAHPPTTDSTLTADLDLTVKSPSGTTIGTSARWENNYEIVEFTASTTGTHQAQILKARFDATSEVVGFAYAKY